MRITWLLQTAVVAMVYCRVHRYNDGRRGAGEGG